MPRKILVINPNTSDSMTRDIERAANEVKLPDTEITCISPPTGPESIETYLDEILAAIGVLTVVAQTKDVYDGFVVACGDDPGFMGAREITDKPVVPIGLAPMLLAPLLGRKFSILGTWSGDKPRSEDKVTRYGLSSYLASVLPSGESVLAGHSDHEALLPRLESLGQQAVAQDGAEVLITTCAGMAGIRRALQDSLKVPVLEGVACAVKLTEVLIDMEAFTSRVGQYEPLRQRKDLIGHVEFSHLPPYAI
jgi:allantoin racemase